MTPIDLILYTATAVFAGTIFIKSDKRYAYIAGFAVALCLIIRAFLNGDIPFGVAFGLLMAWLSFRERQVFVGPASARKWQKWPWY